MSEEQKKKYLDAFSELKPLFDEIFEERSGPSWWSPPGEDWHFTCDVGYVIEFFEQLEEWLRNDGESRYNTRKSNSILICPPDDQGC